MKGLAGVWPAGRGNICLREEDRHALRAASLAYIFHVYVHDYQSSKDSPWDNLERFFVG